MSSPVHRFALIPAAGSGARFGGGLPKQYAALAGEPLLKRTIAALSAAPALDAIFVVLARDDSWYQQHVGSIAGVEPLHCGGATRAESVRNALAAVGGQAAADDWVLVHDAARPCIDAEALSRLLRELDDDPVGGLLALPVADTLKRADGGACPRVAATEPRDGLLCAQTPQMFRYAILDRAYREADLATITDEAQAIEALGAKPRLVMGSPANIKVTFPDDLALAEAILTQRRSTP